MRLVLLLLMLAHLMVGAWAGYGDGKRRGYESGFAAGAASVDCPDGPGIVSASVRWITPKGDTLYQRIWPDTTYRDTFRRYPRPKLVFSGHVDTLR